MASIELDGADVGKNIVLAPGALVPVGKSLKAGNLYVGKPVKLRRKLTPEECNNIRSTTEIYVTLNKQYRAPGNLT